MQAWMWCIFGLVCLGIEATTPGAFVFLFFGVAALCLGALVGLGWIGPAWLQSVAFLGIAVSSMLALRGRLRRRMAWVGSDAAQPELATAAEDIAPGAIGQVQLRGTVWRGRNTSSDTLRTGQTYRVVAIDNLTVVLQGRGPQGELL